ncbi:transporter, partial [Ideonella sp. B508-1]|uniref:SphA family protein n=1 Tax=Ideonella sp. B508-1 TaxID=137716 RepID=UPI0003B5FEAE
MKSTHPLRHVAAAVSLVGLLGMSPSGWATEGNGLGVYPDGLENFLSGALPPPGVHGLVYAGGASYDKVRDGSGQSIGPADFKVNVGAVVPRLVWVTQQQLLGGQLAFEALAPLLNVDVTAGGQKFSKSGLGDVVLGTALGYHHSPELHSAVGMDVYLPTGSYSKTDPASLGRNIVTWQPLAAVSYMPAQGFNADLKAMWDINGRNDDTDTRSGQALHADYALGWGMGNGWVLGVGGHIYRQITQDSGPNAGSGKASSNAIGPSVRYADGKGLL